MADSTQTNHYLRLGSILLRVFGQLVNQIGSKKLSDNESYAELEKILRDIKADSDLFERIFKEEIKEVGSLNLNDNEKYAKLETTLTERSHLGGILERLFGQEINVVDSYKLSANDKYAEIESILTERLADSDSHDIHKSHLGGILKRLFAQEVNEVDLLQNLSPNDRYEKLEAILKDKYPHKVAKSTTLGSPVPPKFNDAKTIGQYNWPEPEIIEYADCRFGKFNEENWRKHYDRLVRYEYAVIKAVDAYKARGSGKPWDELTKYVQEHRIWKEFKKLKGPESGSGNSMRDDYRADFKQARVWMMEWSGYKKEVVPDLPLIPCDPANNDGLYLKFGKGKGNGKAKANGKAKGKQRDEEEGDEEDL